MGLAHYANKTCTKKESRPSCTPTGRKRALPVLKSSKKESRRTPKDCRTEKKYRKRHEQYGEELEESLIKYGSDINAENQKALHTSIKNYVQYPTPTIQDTNQFKAPIIPFDASFTIEGINGFRYGDVLKFEGLPDRYTKNTVFSIIGINHSVSSTGEWNTEIRCIMRPKID